MLPHLLYPFIGVARLIRWGLLWMWGLLVFLLMAPTATRKVHSVDDGLGGVVGTLTVPYVLLTVTFAFFSGNMTLRNPEIWRIAATGLLAVNALSLVYEIGRAGKKKDDMKRGIPENSHPGGAIVGSGEAKPKEEKPDTFSSMWDKIRGMEDISADQDNELYIEVIELLKNRKIDCKDAMALATAIYTGRAETIKAGVTESKI